MSTHDNSQKIIDSKRNQSNLNTCVGQKANAEVRSHIDQRFKEVMQS